MALSKRAATYISVLAIAAYWIYRLATLDRSRTLPAEFTEFVTTIVIAKVLVLASIWLLLKLGHEGFTALSLTRREWPKAIGVGLVLGLVMFLALNVMLNSFMNSVFPRSESYGPQVMDLFRDPRNLLVWLLIGIFGGGVVEELQRIFIVTRFGNWLGKSGLVLGVVLSSVMFGVGHLYQGIGSAVTTGISGLVFALLYFKRRSALELITAHAVSDVFAIVAATMMSAGR